MRQQWLVGPWLTHELYPEQLLTQVVGLIPERSFFARCEVRPPAARLCVRVDGDSTSARRQLLELLTAATRMVVERELIHQ
jgi:hypothetical protein